MWILKHVQARFDMGFARLVDVLFYPETVTDPNEYGIITYPKSRKHQLLIEMYKIL